MINTNVDFETEKLNKFVDSLSEQQAAKIIEVIESKFTLKNKTSQFFKKNKGGESVTDC